MSSNTPIIGISTNLLTVESGILTGSERLYVNRDYVTSLIKAGAAPMMLPIVPELSQIHRLIDCVDGLLLSGGQDVHPHHYGEDPEQFLEQVLLERDLFEIEALKYAFSQKKPIFGICRGLQLINVAFGGTLYQDIAKQHSGKVIQHLQKAKKDESSHMVDLIKGSWFGDLFSDETLFTNSFHHQAIKKIATNFEVSAKARDGIIEAIEHTGDEFVFAVQWHPEMMTENNSQMQKMFSAFVQEVIDRKNRVYAECK